jgi:hypothetical protein
MTSGWPPLTTYDLMLEVHCRDLFFRCRTTLNVIEEIQQYRNMIW